MGYMKSISVVNSVSSVGFSVVSNSLSSKSITISCFGVVVGTRISVTEMALGLVTVVLLVVDSSIISFVTASVTVSSAVSSSRNSEGAIVVVISAAIGDVVS